MAAAAPLRSALLPDRPALPPHAIRRQAMRIATACTVVALAPLFQRYWPGLASEPAARQLALVKALLLLPVLLSIDRFRDWRAPAGHRNPRH